MFEADPTPAEQIERLEAEIDELREAIQRSRRLVVAGRACAFAGAALFLGLLLGLATFTPVRIVGITVALGGLVLMGSSVGSTKQLERSLKQTEDERNAAIDALEFVESRRQGPLISRQFRAFGERSGTSIGCCITTSSAATKPKMTVKKSIVNAVM